MKSILTIAALTLTMFTASSDAFAWGSLAIDSNQGTAYGLSYDYPNSQAADMRALQECGQGCRVVKNFPKGCGAYAADQAAGGTAYGWGAAATEQAAKSLALNSCAKYGGTQCIVRVWSCNSQ